MDEVMSKLSQRLTRQPDFSPVEFDADAAAAIAPVLRMSYSQEGKACASFFTNREVQSLTAGPEALKPVAGLFTPDHIVYCKAAFLYMKPEEDAAEKMQAFASVHGFKAKIVVVEGLGVFALGKDMKEARIAKSLWLDSATVAAYAESFGGYRHLPNDYVDFIANWETENYRQKVSLSGAGEKRLAGRISIVTGSAQGFGKGIAQEMAKEGAYLVIADMNYDGAKAFAQELNDQYGQDTAIPAMVNVTDEENVKKMMNDTVLHFGGLDVFVNNAGIAKPGSLDEMEKKLFELITSVNYTAYFLCAKYASKVMKLQHSTAPEYMMDIVEVNSKSGLAGSNKNFAYAGSKFGGIGLTQSFAMELTDYNIKVNAICPGNYFDGPLWSDPEKGLFKLYLEAGKIPGAKTVADVKKAYEAKIPMGRGCLPVDVARAIFYCVEQKYETGQAIPVTGGQVMLK